jgi:hypothetical protein
MHDDTHDYEDDDDDNDNDDKRKKSYHLQERPESAHGHGESDGRHEHGEVHDADAAPPTAKLVRRFDHRTARQWKDVVLPVKKR